MIQIVYSNPSSKLATFIVNGNSYEILIFWAEISFLHPYSFTEHFEMAHESSPLFLKNDAEEPADYNDYDHFKSFWTSGSSAAIKAAGSEHFADALTLKLLYSIDSWSVLHLIHTVSSQAFPSNPDFT